MIFGGSLEKSLKYFHPEVACFVCLLAVCAEKYPLTPSGEELVQNRWTEIIVAQHRKQICGPAGAIVLFDREIY